MYIRIPFFVVILLLIISSTSCLKDKLDDRCEVSYYSTAIKPLLISSCSNNENCHVSGGAPGTNYNNYEEVYAEKEEIIRRINLNKFNTQFMPRGANPLSEADIQLLQNWVNAGAKGCNKWISPPWFVAKVLKHRWQAAGNLTQILKQKKNSGPFR